MENLEVAPTSNSKRKFREGPVARSIEQQTAKIPSDVFLWAAGSAVALSFVAQVLAAAKKRSLWARPTRMGQLSLFVGQWAPTLLTLGVYNKMVKVLGRSDSSETARD